jgi:signal transduction histidine kinase
LQNLIGNGIKYCETIPRTVQVTASSGGDDMWLFAVKDNGIGIDEEHYQKIFEPFKRLHDKDRYEGTGLGLATCRKSRRDHLVQVKARSWDYVSLQASG